MKILIAFFLTALLFCSCILGGEASAHGPATPESMVRDNSEKWDAFAKRSFSIDYYEWGLDGNTTITCEADKGVFAPSCRKVYRCCGEDPESSWVDAYPVPGTIFSGLATDLKSLKYDSSNVTDTGFIALATMVVGGEPVRIGISADFDPQYGYPREVVYLGPSFPSIIRISRLEFK
jgi:hypothetical protein